MAEDVKVTRFKVSYEGQAEAAAGMLKVAEALERQKSATKAMDDAVAQSGYLARLASYRAEAAALNAEQDKQAATITKMSAAATENARQVGLQGQAVKETAMRFAELGGNVSRAFSNLSPAVAQFQGVLDPMLRTLGGTLNVLGGGGGLGIAAGGLVALVSGLGAAFGLAAKQADELAKQTRENAKALGNYQTQISALRGEVTQRISTDVGERERQQRLEGGKGTGDEYAVTVSELQALIKQKDEVTKALAQAYKEGDINTVRNLASIRDAINQAPARIASYSRMGAAARSNAVDERAAAQANRQDQLEFAGALMDAGGMPAKPEAAKSANDEASAMQGRIATNQAAIEAIRKMEDDYRQERIAEEEAARKDAFQRELAQSQDHIKQLLDKARELEANKTALLETNLLEQRVLLEQQIGETVTGLHARDAEEMLAAEELKRQAMSETHEQFMALQDEQYQIIQQNLQAERATRAQVNQSMMALGTTLAQMTAKQLSEAVKGHKIQAAMIVEGLGDAMVAEGVRVMFQGATMMLLGNYASGGGLLAVGAAELAAGLALGAAGSAMQPPAPSGAGDANNAPGASPVRDTQSSNGQVERGPTIIYIDIPTVISPSAEDGMRIRQAVDAASRVYGAPV